jgi:biotin carboxylase
MAEKENTKRRRVLLFATKLGYQTRSFEEAARKLCAELVYVTDRCGELEDPWGDGAIPVHFEEPEVAAYMVFGKCRTESVDGILALGDGPTIAAAYAARGLGIAYNHPASVEACRNKLRMREVLRDAGLRTPWFRGMPLEALPEPTLLGITYPCVLKPVALSASQGVIRANSRAEFLGAAQQIRSLLETPEIRAKRDGKLKELLVEGYIPGSEVAVEGLIAKGMLQVLAIFDKPDPLEGPYFEETIYVTPSRLPEETQSAIERCAEKSARALGLTEGPIHTEFRVNEEGVWPLEIAPRPIGGLCARALRFVSDESSGELGLEELLLRHALGMIESAPPREAIASGVMMIPVPGSGILERVEGQEEALATPGVSELHITARLNDTIVTWPEGSSYLGFLFAKGESPEEVCAALRAAHAKLRFTIAPQLPVEHPVTGRFHRAGS